MARRTKLWNATHGRDSGKRFLITEMSAAAAEDWAWRLGLALAAAGIPVPEGSLQSGMAGMASIAAQGIRALQGVQYAAVKPLLAEMIGCVQFWPPESPIPQPLMTGENSQIEEVRSLFELRVAVLELHLDFSLADALSNIGKTSATPALPTD